jgi:hypothetical protein
VDAAEIRRADAMRWWRVEFAGAVSEETNAALDSVGVVPVGGRGRRTGPTRQVERTSSTVLVRAESALDAISRVRGVLDPIDEVAGYTRRYAAEEFPYYAYLGVPIIEVAALDAAGGDDPRIRSVGDWSPAHGEAEILFELRHAESQETALAQAKQAYAELRRRAGLLEAEPLYAMVSSTDEVLTAAFAPVGQTTFMHHVQRARELFDHAEYDLAVVVAQTSCEALVQEAITQLLGEPIDDEPASATTLRSWWQGSRQDGALASDGLTRDLWNALAGDEIQQQHAWWAKYKAHTGRRHGIVHRGASVNRSEAEQSLEATEAFREYVLATFARLSRRGE